MTCLWLGFKVLCLTGGKTLDCNRWQKGQRTQSSADFLSSTNEYKTEELLCDNLITENWYHRKLYLKNFKH